MTRNRDKTHDDRDSSMAKSRPCRRTASRGMNWIRKVRDGLACAWCGEGVEDGAKLTLDHVIPYSDGGSNNPDNLVTACLTCNSGRGNRSVRDYAAVVADYTAAVAAYVDRIDAKSIEKHVTACTRRGIDVKEAKAILARRGWDLAAAKADSQDGRA